MKIVAISGSLRTGSSNTKLLQTVADAMPPGSTMTLFDGLAELPAFNPDLDVDGTPEVVKRFRALIRGADAVAFSSPEYAHGIVGALKNALDWLVGNGELYEKPVAILNVSARGEFAQVALRETLTVMTARIVFEEIVQDADAAARKIVRGVKARNELPKAILFDLDETIISFGDRQTQFREIAEEFTKEIAPLTPEALALHLETSFRARRRDEATHKLWRQDLHGMRRKQIAAAFEELHQPGLTQDLATAFAARFHDHREEQVKFFPDAIETIDELMKRGVRLALITNGAAVPQRAKVERFDLAHRFDHIQIEGEHGFGKPEEHAYRHALAALDVAPEDCWMVGDHLEWEVAAPQRLGIYAVWHDHVGAGLPPDADIRPDRIIRSLSELLPPEF